MVEINSFVYFATSLILLLLFSHGHMNLYILPFVPVAVSLVLLRTRLKNVSTLKIFYFSALILFVVFQYEGVFYTPIQIYAIEKSFLILRNIFYFLSFVFFSFFVFDIKLSLRLKQINLFLMFFLLSISFVVALLASPNPIIDLWNIHETTADAVLKFRNPYTVEIPNPYPLHLQNQITPLGIHAFYLPGIYYLMAPFKYFFGDTRYTSLFALIGTSFLIYLSLRDKFEFKLRVAITYFFMFSPVNFFLLEQGWSDPVVVALLFLFSFCLRKNLLISSSFVLALIFLTKQYAVPVSLVLLLVQKEQLRGKLKVFFFGAIIASFVLGIFSILDFKSFWGSLYGFNFIKDPSLKSVLVPTRSDSLSFSSWLYAITGNAYKEKIFLLFFGLVCMFSFPKTRKKILDTPLLFMSLTYILGLFFFSPYAYFNYYWFSLSLFYFILLYKENIFKFCNFSLNDFFFLTSRLFIFFIFFKPYISDVFLYNQLSTKMYSGQFFETLKTFEYPPLAAIFIFIPKIFSHNPESLLDYRTWFVALCMIFDFLIYQKLKNSVKNQFLLLLYLIQAPILYNLIYDRIDIFLSYFLLVFVLSFGRNSFISILSLSFGTFLKVIPVFLFPFVLTRQWFNKYLFWFLILLFGLLSVIFSENILYLISYHLKRGIQIESIWSIPIVLDSLIFHSKIEVINNFGSFNFKNSSFGLDLFANVSFIFYYIFIIYKFFRSYKNSTYEFFLTTSTLILISFISLFKVFSPQYLIWPMPLLILMLARLKKIFFILHISVSWILICILTQILWSNYSTIFQNSANFDWKLLVLRNCLVIYNLFLLSRIFLNESYFLAGKKSESFFDKIN
jgi:hypothetical protein